MKREKPKLAYVNIILGIIGMILDAYFFHKTSDGFFIVFGGMGLLAFLAGIIELVYFSVF